MAEIADIRAVREPGCRLVEFDPAWAEHVVRWVRDERESYWLAPKSTPPLTAREILGWRKPDHHPYMLVLPARAAPIAYGELNRLSGARRCYWLGHLIVDPEYRGQGWGVALTRALLDEAFQQRGARRVTLIVFPENTRAVACYRAAGLREDGHEWHTFTAHGRRECLIRMAAGGP